MKKRWLVVAFFVGVYLGAFIQKNLDDETEDPHNHIQF